MYTGREHVGGDRGIKDGREGDEAAMKKGGRKSPIVDGRHCASCVLMF